MPIEPQELLDMRLTALAQDVARVAMVADDAMRRHESHNKLSELIGGSDSEPISTPLQKAYQFLSAVRDVIEDDPALERATRKHDIFAELEQVRSGIREARRKVCAAKEALSTMDSLMIRVDSSDSTITNGLGKRCERLKGDIQKLRDDLADPQITPRVVWHGYETTLEEHCQSLFADYVDFLGGLTLRDTSLDDDVCSIADELLREIPGQVKRLAVPARRPGPITAWDELVKLGFPEWTVWNVPHIAYEIGRVHAANDFGRRIIGRVRNTLPDRSSATYEALFAEAYGAYTVGPAYGCAAMLLKLQPDHDHTSGLDPSDVERAATVQVVLKLIGEESTGFTKLVGRTDEYWREAVVHLSDTDALDAASEQVTAFATGITEALREERMLPFDHRDWPAVTDLADRLSQPSVQPGNTAGARVLLNAAWVARLASPRSQRWAERVTANVREIWKSRTEMPSDGGRRDRS